MLNVDNYLCYALAIRKPKANKQQSKRVIFYSFCCCLFSAGRFWLPALRRVLKD